MDLTQVGIVLAVALVVVFLSYVVTYRRTGVGPFDRMGRADWKFTESWASTLTASGGLLAAALAAGVLPSGTEEQKVIAGSLATFHLMFAAAIVVAAALYNTFRFPKAVAVSPNGTPKVGETPSVEVPIQNPTPTVQYQGFVVCFLLSSATVLWAVLCQLLAVWHLLGEVPSLPGPIRAAFGALLGLAGILALIYGSTSVPWTLRNQSYKDEFRARGKYAQEDRVRSAFYLP